MAAPPRPVRERLVAAGGALGATLLGLLPHVLHHAGPLAGAAIFAGTGGSLLFGAIGFVVAIPFLIGLRTRSGNWRLPTAALALFAVAFSVSTFVIGPQIGTDDDVDADSPAGEQPAGHEAHH